MSTSPSWFDQEKLSRLVKKVGTKTVTELPHVQLGDQENRPPSENPALASTARISLVSKPPSLLADQRALPALPRRTGTLPSIKSFFPNTPPPIPQEPAPAPERIGTETGPVPVAHEGHIVIPSGQDVEDLDQIWHKMSLLNEELAKTVLERDQAHTESAELREQLRRADELLNAEPPPPEKPDPAAVSEEMARMAKDLDRVTRERDGSIAEGQALRAQLLQARDAQREREKESPAASSEDVAKLTKERDDAIAEGQALRAQLLQAKAAEKEKASVTLGDTQQITIVTGERDQARRQYSELRKQYETLKQEQAPKEETIKFRKEWEQQMEELKGRLAEREKEIAALKSANVDDKLKQEAVSLREQLAKAKDEASVAQRGLALSQKALQQTRDTLREATEGTSLSRHNFDNLKNECAILVQQNTVLQAQNDQLTRDLSASKNKATTRLST